jgi:hypothetical protein
MNRLFPAEVYQRARLGSLILNTSGLRMWNLWSRLIPIGLIGLTIDSGE